MSISPLERILLITVLVSLAYRYVTNEWPVSVEVEE